jgi:hypothetical protein
MVHSVYRSAIYSELEMNDSSDLIAKIRARSVNDLPKREPDPSLAYFLLGVFVAYAFMAVLFGG